MISVTDMAAKKISEAQNGQEMNDKMLRIGVFPGGCGGGYQYVIQY